MVYIVDLDDTLVLTKNLNNDAYNFALEQNGQKRNKTNKRLTRETLGETLSKKLIADKQNYFVQKWLKYRVIVNEEIISILQNQNKENCYLWTSADKNRADYILKELDLYKYFNKVIYDGKIKGLGGHISLKYENYCDEEGWIFNGEIITKANIAGNGTFEGCIEVSGLYSAKIYYDNVKLADSIPSEGTYGVEMKDSTRAEVSYTLYFEKL